MCVCVCVCVRVCVGRGQGRHLRKPRVLSPPPLPFSMWEGGGLMQSTMCGWGWVASSQAQGTKCIPPWNFHGGGHIISPLSVLMYIRPDGPSDNDFHSLSFEKKLCIGFIDYTLVYTVNILCIGTNRSQQTVQTKIRLLLKKQSDQGQRCLPLHQLLLDALMQCYIKLYQF